jgi:polysaccharide export outer membrane protein
MSSHTSSFIATVGAVISLCTGVAAQQPNALISNAVGSSSDAVRAKPPLDYVIGPEDQLSVIFFQNRDMSADVTVRPDGKISLPLLNEVQASGLTPDQLRQQISAEAKRFIQEPNATVVVRQINSRKVSIIGSVEKPGTFSLGGPTTVLQLIGSAAGLKEYAKSRKITIIRNDHGRQVKFDFDYREVIEQRRPDQNIELQPGDTVIVP